MRRKFRNRFRVIATVISNWAGSASVFLGAIVVVLVWAATGPMSNFSDTWQLVINTGTTIITFLMVFLIQNTQNRDTKAIQLKLDELIHANKAARDTFVGLEELTDEELAALDAEFREMNDNPAVANALLKLRRSIDVERTKRVSLRSRAARVVESILKPLNATIPVPKAAPKPPKQKDK